MRLCSWSSRTAQRPMGGGRQRRLHWKERRDNILWRHAFQLTRAADQGGTPWILENPNPSLAWNMRGWVRLFNAPGGARYEASVDWCRYGRKWRKSTLFRGRAPFLPELSRKCKRDHQHEVLEGQTSDSKGKAINRTQLAAEYSRSFCNELARKATMYYKVNVLHRRHDECPSSSSSVQGPSATRHQPECKRPL